MNLLKFYSKLHKYCEDDGTEIALTSEQGLLLDFVDKEWSMNKNKGLAMYLNDPFSNYVSSIQYSYAKGGYLTESSYGAQDVISRTDKIIEYKEFEIEILEQKFKKYKESKEFEEDDYYY